MIKLSIKLTILCQLRVGNNFSKHKWGYKLQNFHVAAPPAPNAISYFTIWNESHLPAVKASLCLDSFHTQYYFPNHWSIKIFFFYLYDMIRLWSFDFEQHKYENLIQKRSMGPYVAKMFFIQSKQMKLSGYAGAWYKNI